DARPDGNVDVIRWLFHIDRATQFAMVESGKADAPYQLATPELTDRLERLYPDQIRFPNPLWNVAHWFDPRAFPLSAPDVRLAINEAVDRSAITKVTPWYTVASCQALLPGVPSYVPYCPYTADHLADGAPDLDRARALVRRANAVGAAVTIQTFAADDPDGFGIFVPLQEKVIAAMRAIGLRVVAKPMP